MGCEDLASVVARAVKDFVVLEIERNWCAPVDPTSNVGAKLVGEMSVQQLLHGDGSEFGVSWRRLVHCLEGVVDFLVLDVHEHVFMPAILVAFHLGAEYFCHERGDVVVVVGDGFRGCLQPGERVGLRVKEDLLVLEFEV